MQAIRQLGAIALLLGCAELTGTAQSLGDIARQQQEQKNSTSSTARHVITNEDISSGTQAAIAGADAEPGKGANTEPQPVPAKDAKSQSAAELLAKIRAQKQKLLVLQATTKDLQQKLDRWKTSDCTHVLYADNKNACGAPPNVAADYERSNSQLQKEQAALLALQEQARKLGYGNSFYDPQ